MTMEDDVAKLAELSRELPTIDVDSQSAERIAMRARQDVGRGPSPRRLVEPVLATLLVGSYLVWAVLKIVEALG
ncbi:MAG: hypothetical protein H0T42_02755 [Deltaproteobacteria bacterium]|nr:hypothetical protein [Deltaproteobacteria bacterium]